MKNKKRLLITIAIILTAILLLIFFYIDPTIYPFFPKCPFKVATGFECPGCGSQRAFHQLLHLNVAAAFRHNPLIVLYGPYVLVGLYFEYLGGKSKHRRIQTFLFGKQAAVIILISIIIFWIGRNIF